MNGYWESWAGEGNPSLEISSGTIKLMLDTRTGEREDALPYMDQTVPGFVLNPGFQYDCKNGFKEPEYIHPSLKDILKPIQKIKIWLMHIIF